MKLASALCVLFAISLVGCGDSARDRMSSSSGKSTVVLTPERQKFVDSLGNFDRTVASLVVAYEGTDEANRLGGGLVNNSASVMNMKGSEFVRQAGSISDETNQLALAREAVRTGLADLWKCYEILESSNSSGRPIEQFLGNQYLADPAWFMWAPTVRNVRSGSSELLTQLLGGPAWPTVDKEGDSNLVGTSPGQQLDAEGQFALGRRYSTGDGVEWNSLLAARWYRKAVQSGHAEAQVYLGVCYMKGFGVPRNDATAVGWYQKAAEQNRVEAFYNLGYCFANGLGVAKNESQAVAWYRRAADQNYVAAQVRMGDCYHFGDGVPKDLSEAVRWYKSAAEQGDAAGQRKLGDCYRNGDGVRADKVEAYKWHFLAQGGEGSAWSAIGTLKDDMSGAQIVEAERLAKLWTLQHPFKAASSVSDNGARAD